MVALVSRLVAAKGLDLIVRMMDEILMHEDIQFVVLGTGDKEYEDWKEHRNPARYESNLEGEKSGNPDMMYDCKNMMHCFRLMAMAKEIADGKGVILDRTGIDRDFLLDVRNRKYGYSELQKRMLDLKDEMDKAIENSTIKDDIDPKMVNDILLKARTEFNK